VEERECVREGEGNGVGVGKGDKGGERKGG
jgi:hypothetical protein